MSKTGIVIADLGTTKKPTLFSVAAFLGRFLSDPRVIRLPSCLRYPLVWGCIVPLRSMVLLQRYRKISHPLSPLYTGTEALQKELQNALGSNFHVTFGFLYSPPSLLEAYRELKSANCSEIKVLSLSPIYTDVITGAIEAQCNALDPATEHITLPLEEVATLWKDTLTRYTQGDHTILMSYHGLPMNSPQIETYLNSVKTVSALIAKEAGIPEERYRVAFQSQFGFGSWSAPSVEEVMQKLLAEKRKKVIVITPSFIVDCLETKWEQEIYFREQFLALGGSEWLPLPCPGIRSVNALARLVQ
jgi:protoporphyrin/coproporphyrin ferrochelatase